MQYEFSVVHGKEPTVGALPGVYRARGCLRGRRKWYLAVVRFSWMCAEKVGLKSPLPYEHIAVRTHRIPGRRGWLGETHSRASIRLEAVD